MHSTRSMMRLESLLLMVAVPLLLPIRASAETTVQHSGATDPALEGWVTTGSGFAVLNDLGTGVDAWATDDDSMFEPSGAAYFFTPSASQIADGAALGWTLTARLRVVDVPDTPEGSPLVLYRDGSRSFQMHFGSEADGDPIVALVGSALSYTLQGTGGGYHLYELVFDPFEGSADLFVDGAEVLSDYEGFALAATGVIWGSGSTPDIGQGNFNRVAWSTGSVPVPVGPGVAIAVMIAALIRGVCSSGRSRPRIR